jgi:pimeloyl-ACP methyl ester carboxylesterase
MLNAGIVSMVPAMAEHHRGEVLADGAVRESLTLAAQGSFFVNGSRDKIAHTSTMPLPAAPGLDLGAGGHVATGQMYVQFQIPQLCRPGCLPVVLVHGGCHTAACWESTPDGREGWATDLLRAGIPVYLVDQVTRGRSGFPVSFLLAEDFGGPTQANVFTMSEETMWAVGRFGPQPGQWWPDACFPAEHLENYLPQLLPDFNFGIADPYITVQALVALVDRIGPAVVVTHSESGDYGYRLSLLRPELVAGIIAVEGASTVDEERLSDIHARIPTLSVWGDHVEGHALYEPLHQQARALIDRLTDAGGKAHLLSLPDVGVVGNGHMMMLDRNSSEIAARLIDWLDEVVFVRKGSDR